MEGMLQSLPQHAGKGQNGVMEAIKSIFTGPVDKGVDTGEAGRRPAFR